MLKTKRLAALVTVVAIFFSCTKQNVSTSNDTLQINADKQVKNFVFSDYAFESKNDISTNGNALIANKIGATAQSPTIELSKFLSPAPFISVYGSFSGTALNAQNIKIEFAGSKEGTQWDNWITINSNDDADANSNQLIFNNIELNKDAHFVKFKITYLNTDAQLNEAKIFFFNPQITSPEEQGRIDEAAKNVQVEMSMLKLNNSNIDAPTNPALCVKPNFTARSSWGARAAKSAPSFTTVNFIIVHHEEGSNSSTDWAARVRAVQNLHMDVNGWADIAYNYLVDPNGVAYEGRGGGENVVGAHLCAKNTNTMGICMLGGYTSVLPTNNALYTLKRILAWKCVQRNLNPEATGFHVDRTIFKVSGHRSSCSTDCPGTTLFNFLPTLRNDLNVNFIAKCK
jgi:N-acetylmuramoyl-L-alanine amidase